MCYMCYFLEIIILTYQRSGLLRKLTAKGYQLIAKKTVTCITFCPAFLLCHPDDRKDLFSLEARDASTTFQHDSKVLLFSAFSC